MSESTNPPHHNFLVVPGRWHPEMAYERYIAELNIDHTAELVHLQGDKVGATVLDHSRLVVETGKKYENVTLVGHSLGAVIAAHAVEPLQQEGCEVKSLQNCNTGGPLKGGNRYKPGLREDMIDQKDGTNKYNPEKVIERFFNDDAYEDGDYVMEVAANFIPWCIQDGIYIPAPELHITTYSIRGDRDDVHDESCIKETDANWMHTEPIIMKGAGHSPYTTKPKESAALTIRLAHIAHIKALLSKN